MPEPAFDTLEAARRLKSAGIEVKHAEAIVEVMGQSVNQLVTRAHFDLAVERLGTAIATLETELNARIDGVESKLQSLEATLRKEIMRSVLIMVGILIPAVGLMMAIFEFYTNRGGGA